MLVSRNDKIWHVQRIDEELFRDVRGKVLYELMPRLTTAQVKPKLNLLRPLMATKDKWSLGWLTQVFFLKTEDWGVTITRRQLVHTMSSCCSVEFIWVVLTWNLEGKTKNRTESRVSGQLRLVKFNYLSQFSDSNQKNQLQFKAQKRRGLS